MILHRFMSKREYDALMSGEDLFNGTDHAAQGEMSDSVGFCFFAEDPEDAIEWLSFLVDADYCVTMEMPDWIARESHGRYRDVENDKGEGLFDEVPMLWRKEYCTTRYSLRQIQVLHVTEEYAPYGRIPDNITFLEKVERLRCAGEMIRKRKEKKMKRHKD